MIKLILTDIEGTISPITFVKEVLFPYARQNLGNYIRENIDSDPIKNIIIETENICETKLSLEEIITTLNKWNDEDRKVTPLKTIQGYIWEQGFKNNIFKSRLYSDALTKLTKWKKMNIPIYIYSSGSVFAQKLFFKYNETGDILFLFSGYFDTTIGNKKEKSSYEKISKETNTASMNILFLSDTVEELDAACEAGMQTILINRSGQEIICKHEICDNFDTLNLDTLQELKI